MLEKNRWKKPVFNFLLSFDIFGKLNFGKIKKKLYNLSNNKDKLLNFSKSISVDILMKKMSLLSVFPTTEVFRKFGKLNFNEKVIRLFSVIL